MAELTQKTPTWAELKKVVRGGRDCIRSYINSFDDELQPAVALALSVAHWSRSERKHMFEWGEIYTDTCGLCQFYGGPFRSCQILDDLRKDAVPCPLKESHGMCGGRDDYPWDRVHDVILYDRGIDRFNHYADHLYNVLVALYAEAWDKL